MTTEVPPQQLYDMAAVLRAAGTDAEIGRVALVGGAVGGLLQAPVEEHLAVAHTALGAVSGQLRLLGDTVASVADSWLGLDGSLLSLPGQAVPR